ncbi:uncharacterized protein LOC133298491 isoform X3 [Gastrolobium bilobum]|uniref:uncharacterized protein LOC133298491 isoform X3 n=1 Tax=Gastrolobium bilobum TaxID=150636 RepID=UPI002AB19ADB|nr:uncharacterized protein LOC133298491 isoform X3 [Gastrolobium bilobum]
MCIPKFLSEDQSDDTCTFRGLKQVPVGTSDMSSGSVRRVSREDIQQVQNLIERCLQLYMNPKEVVETLLTQAKIEPGFTELVAQNRSCYAAELARAAMKPENMQHTVDSNLHNVFNNGWSSLRSSMNAVVEMSAHSNRIDSPPMLSTQSSSMGLMIQGINGGMIKSEPGYPGSSPYIFGSDGTVLEACPTIGDASVASCNGVDSNSHPMNGALLDPDISSFGVLGQISGNLSLSDLTADFSLSSDIMESYPRCPYLATADENFLERGEQG